MTARPIRRAAVIGGGVIGGGWAARFLLNGWDVNLFDPDPQASRKLDEVLGNARRSLPQLSDGQMPEAGTVRFCNTIADAVAEADWVQESVPEQLPLKHKILAQIVAGASANAIVASSTSGFRPGELRSELPDGATVIVAHPFNPVYLLPLVELVGTPDDDPDLMQRASKLITDIGMKPLPVRKEIDAHIADRLLEAVWRESLWLVNDDVATTEEVDDAIRYGFGLRWAQMGLFETYRLAGGEGGMAHFVRQFGPALQWPWTKLMDVPELTEELIEKIATQSDQQSGRYSVRELEQIRDQNLVGILRSLKDRNWGAGAVLNEYDRSAIMQTGEQTDQNGSGIEAPLQLYRCSVLPAWIDYNGHMTEYRYLQVFADSTDCLLRWIGANQDYVAGGHSFFTVETHLVHIDECKAGEGLVTTTQLFESGGKKLHIYQEILAGEERRLVASCEQMLLHVTLGENKVCPAVGIVGERLGQVVQAHQSLPKPENTGRRIGKKPGT